MKRNRNELVSQVIGKYLKRRNYTDNEVYKKSDLKLHQTLEEMSLHGTIQSETGIRNVISVSSISGDATAIDQQFTRLKTFLSEASEPYKSELTYILFPMFIHLYLELISNGQKAAAQKFHARHHSLFMHSEHYKTVVESLPHIVTTQDLSSQPHVKEFRTNKYTVKLHQESLEYLLRLLKDSDHLILLQVFNLHIDIEVPFSEQWASLHHHDDKPDIKVKTEASSGIVDENSSKSVSSKTEAVSALKDVIQRVRDGPPCLPSICLFTVTNAFQGMCSTSLSHDVSMAAVGFEDSSVRLWSLTPETLLSEPAAVNVSQIHLSCDTLPEMEEAAVGNSTMKVMRGHSGPVNGLNFVPKAPVLLSCSEDTTVRAWSLKTHTNVALYRGHQYPVWDIDVSPLGLYFATASMDHTARIWTLDRTYPLRILAGHNLDVDCVKFHPNCNYVATGSSDRMVCLWSVQDGKMVRMFHGHRGGVFALAFSPNGQLLASAGEDRRIKIWDIASGSLMKELRGHTDAVYSISFNSDASVLASGGLEHALRLWDVRRGVTSHSAGTGGGTGGAAGSTLGSTGGMESHMSPELLAAYQTKATSLQLVEFSWHNLLLAVGVAHSTTVSS